MCASNKVRNIYIFLITQVNQASSHRTTPKRGRSTIRNKVRGVGIGVLVRQCARAAAFCVTALYGRAAVNTAALEQASGFLPRHSEAVWPGSFPLLQNLFVS